MGVYFHKEDRDVPLIDEGSIIKTIKHFCDMGKKEVGDINFIYCSDEFLLKMNIQYLEHNYYTDVITFNYCDGNIISGDVFMSRDRMDENASELKINEKAEYIRVCAHGFLHLLGFNDSTGDEKAEMRKNEDRFIELTHT